MRDGIIFLLNEIIDGIKWLFKFFFKVLFYAKIGITSISDIPTYRMNIAIVTFVILEISILGSCSTQEVDLAIALTIILLISIFAVLGYWQDDASIRAFKRKVKKALFNLQLSDKLIFLSVTVYTNQKSIYFFSTISLEYVIDYKDRLERELNMNVIGIRCSENDKKVIIITVTNEKQPDFHRAGWDMERRVKYKK